MSFFWEPQPSHISAFRSFIHFYHLFCHFSFNRIQNTQCGNSSSSRCRIIIMMIIAIKQTNGLRLFNWDFFSVFIDFPFNYLLYHCRSLKFFHTIDHRFYSAKRFQTGTHQDWMKVQTWAIYLRIPSVAFCLARLNYSLHAIDAHKFFAMKEENNNRCTQQVENEWEWTTQRIEKWYGSGLSCCCRRHRRRHFYCCCF